MTAQRVRDGEPGALHALVERRGGAVLAYCEQVAAPEGARSAAGEAFARFRRAVVAAGDPRALDPEAVLLRETRQAAAAAAPRTVGPRGPLARRLGATCLLVPELLAARAEGALTTADRLRLSRHLERCEDCRGALERFAAGERAYREAPDEAPDPETAEALRAALRDAAPVVAGVETEGEPDPAPEPVAPPAATDEPATLSWDAADVAAASPPRRRPLVRALALLVPVVVFLLAMVVAFAVAGVFSDDGAGDPAGSIQTQETGPPSTVRVHARPSTTPLPERAAPEPTAPAEQPVSRGDGARTSPAKGTPSSGPTSAPSRAPESQTELSADTARDAESAPPTGGSKPPSDGGFTATPPSP